MYVCCPEVVRSFPSTSPLVLFNLLSLPSAFPLPALAEPWSAGGSLPFQSFLSGLLPRLPPVTLAGTTVVMSYMASEPSFFVKRIILVVVRAG